MTQFLNFLAAISLYVGSLLLVAVAVCGMFWVATKLDPKEQDEDITKP
jgi:hypothetical protein